MTGRLDPRLARSLDALARPGTLVVLDFDGTLAPIRADREAAKPTRRSLAAIRALEGRYPVAILSGRSAADVRARLDGVHLRWVVGSHGAEWPGEERRHPAWRALVRGWAATLRTRLAGSRGIEVEAKPLSLAVHFRRAGKGARRAEARVLAAARDLPGAAIFPGKRVVNLIPAGAGGKGAALQRLARESKAERVLFIGDDVTDEAAFAARLPVPLVTVRVGRSSRTRAQHAVASRADVDHVLEGLAAGPRGPRPAEVASREAWPGGDSALVLGPVLAFLKDLWALEEGLSRRSRAMLRRTGVTGPQRLVVRVVGRVGPATPAELARILHLHRSSLTRLLKKLEQRSFVRIRPNPERAGSFLVEPGARADRVEGLWEGTVEAAVSQALEAIDAGEVAAASRVVREVTRRLTEHPS